MSLEIPLSAAIFRAPARFVESAPPISADLAVLVVRFDHRPVRIVELLEATKGRGFHLLLLLVALRFLTPLPLPGFSILFGLTISLLLGRLALGLNPRLPQRVRQSQLPAHSLARLVGLAGRVMRGMERFVRPRLGCVGDHVVFRRVGGLLIAISGLMMMLLFPLPLSNSLPAWPILFPSAGTLGRDGLCFFAGCTAFALSVAYLGLVAVGCVQAPQRMWEMWTATRGGQLP